MATEADPIVGGWYLHLDKGQRFQVVAVDESAGTVEMQHFDGDVEEVDADAWYTLDVETAEAPENWSGSLDVSEPDDFGTGITDTSSVDWNEPLTEIRRRAHGVEQPQLSEEVQDDWGEGVPQEEPLEGE